jgi:hypothetical protein
MKTTKFRLILGAIILGTVVTLLSGCANSTATTGTSTPTSTSTTTSPSTSTTANPAPLEIVSVLGPLAPINPGGPIVEITVKNISAGSIVSLTVTLELSRTFQFNFDVTGVQPLLPSQSIIARQTLIGGGFSDNTDYTATVAGTAQNGTDFKYTRQVTIQNAETRLAPIDEVKVNLLKSNPPQIGVYIKAGLPDGCSTPGDIETTRAGNSVNIKVTIRHPIGVFCPAIYTTFEKNVNLGTDFTMGTTYTLNVNDYTTTFTY